MATATTADEAFHESSSADEVTDEDAGEEQEDVYDTVATDAAPTGEEEMFDTVMGGMDAARVAELYMERLAAVDTAASPPSRRPIAAAPKPTKSGSKPRLNAAGAGAGTGAVLKRRPTNGGGNGTGSKNNNNGDSNGDQPASTFSAEVRCACRIGTTLWAGERDGSLVVREAATGRLIERIVSGHGWESILSIAPVGPSTVWCGTSDGPILLLSKANRKQLGEVRQHSGGVLCLCCAPQAGGRGFVVSGGADRRLHMWQLDGKWMKAYSGHTGGVRCVLVLGMQIWSGSDDGSVRVWDAAFGLFQLETQPCRAVLTGHTGAVHSLVAHSNALLSCGADGSVRCWKPSGQHECLREVSLSSGPLYQLVPMGRHVWAAAADGKIVSLDGVSLDVVGTPRHSHAGFVSGLCALQARTTRQCWSFSTSDGRVCRWRIDELEPQHTSERAGLLGAEVEALTAQMACELEERRAEQQRHADETQRDADELAARQAACEQLAQEREALLAELSANMEMQERDLQESERLQGVVAAREAQIDEVERCRAAEAEAAQVALEATEQRALAAEAEAEGLRQEAAAQQRLLEREQAARVRQQRSAERLARKEIAAALRIALCRRRARPRTPIFLTSAAVTLAPEEWAGTGAGASTAPPRKDGAAASAADAFVDAALGLGALSPCAEELGGAAEHGGRGASLVSTAASLEELLESSADDDSLLLASSRDVPTVTGLDAADLHGRHAAAAAEGLMMSVDGGA